MKKKLIAILAAAALITPILLTSCSGGEDSILKHATEIKLNGATAECDSETVYIDENNKITITRAGTYAVSGTLDDGQIYVDCVDAGELDLALNGASITNNDSSCIVIKNATEAVITLYEGTVNTVTDGTSYVFDKPTDDEPDAAIFSKGDLHLSRSRQARWRNCNYAGGIYSKDGLKIEGGECEINAAAHGIKGKDYLVINGGTLDIHAIGDGIKVEQYRKRARRGDVEINGGKLNIYSRGRGCSGGFENHRKRRRNCYPVHQQRYQVRRLHQVQRGISVYRGLRTTLSTRLR